MGVAAGVNVGKGVTVDVDVGKGVAVGGRVAVAVGIAVGLSVGIIVGNGVWLLTIVVGPAVKCSNLLDYFEYRCCALR